jgi:hypothetical protein
VRHRAPFQFAVRFLRNALDGDRYHAATITQPFWMSTKSPLNHSIPVV